MGKTEREMRAIALFGWHPTNAHDTQPVDMAWAGHLAVQTMLYIDNTQEWYNEKLAVFAQIRAGSVPDFPKRGEISDRTKRAFGWIIVRAAEDGRSKGELPAGDIPWPDMLRIYKHIRDQYREWLRYQEEQERGDQTASTRPHDTGQPVSGEAGDPA